MGKGRKAHRRPRLYHTGKQELLEKDEGQEYAQVAQMLGNGHVEAICFDGVLRLCRIRGRMRNTATSNRVSKGDIVLVGLRHFQDHKADIILKYSAVEARELKTRNALPAHVQIGDGPEMDEGCGFEFADGVSADDSDSEFVVPQPAQVGMLPPSDEDHLEDVDLDNL